MIYLGSVSANAEHDNIWHRLPQVDSLRTNHRGTFVLKDNHFRCVAHPLLGSCLPGLVVSQAARHQQLLAAWFRLTAWPGND